MKKFAIMSYILGILLSFFVAFALSNPSFLIENVREEVLKYSSNGDSSIFGLVLFSLFAIGSVFLVGAFQANYYMKNPDDKTPLYFSFYCWSMIISIILTIFPFGSWVIILKLVYIFSYINFLSLHLYLHSFFQKKISPFLSSMLWTAVSILIILTAFTSIEFAIFLSQSQLCFSIPYFVYLLILSWQQFRLRTPQSVGNFISMVILILCLFQDVLVGLKYVEGGSLLGLGIFVFFTIHSALNTERFLNAFSQTATMRNLLQKKVEERTKELENANREMRRIEKEKEQLVSNICHDLATPISSINIVANGILDEVIPANDKQFVKEIINKSNLMEKLLEDLRQLNVLENKELKFQMEKVEWCHFAEKMFKDFQTSMYSEGIHYTLRMDGDTKRDRMVMIDPIQMERVFGNIIYNSIKFTPIKGSIEVIVGCNRDQQRAWLTIADNGIGIEPAYLPFIFERFYRTKPIRPEKPSTGLGLNIVKNIVERHSGNIQVESEKGKGTSITIHLPLIVE